MKASIRKLSSDRYTAMRDAYYQACAGLHNLAAQLDHAVEEHGEATDLREEHRKMMVALDAFNEGQLGRFI